MTQTYTDCIKCYLFTPFVECFMNNIWAADTQMLLEICGMQLQSSFNHLGFFKFFACIRRGEKSLSFQVLVSD